MLWPHTTARGLTALIGHLIHRVLPAGLICCPANPKDTVGHKWSFRPGVYGGRVRGWDGGQRARKPG